MTIYEAATFTGREIPGVAGIAGYISEYCDDQQSHRVAERAIMRARKINGAAYAMIDGRPHQISEFAGVVPAGWREIETRYELNGERYYLNAPKSHYLRMVDYSQEGRRMGYMPTIAVRIAI